MSNWKDINHVIYSMQTKLHFIYKCISYKSLAFKNEKLSGNRHNKERLAILFSKICNNEKL